MAEISRLTSGGVSTMREGEAPPRPFPDRRCCPDSWLRDPPDREPAARLLSVLEVEEPGLPDLAAVPFDAEERLPEGRGLPERVLSVRVLSVRVLSERVLPEREPDAPDPDAPDPFRRVAD